MSDKSTHTGSSDANRETGTRLVKRGLAEMLSGGVIMDVVNAEQARWPRMQGLSR